MLGGIGLFLRGIAIGPCVNQRPGISSHGWPDLSQRYSDLWMAEKNNQKALKRISRLRAA